MKTLCDGGGIHEVASAQTANDVLIQVFDLYSDLLLRTDPPPITIPNPCAFPAWESPLSSDPTAKPRSLRDQPKISSQGLTLSLCPAEGSSHSGGSLHVDSPDFPFPGETTRRGRHNAQAS